MQMNRLFKAGLATVVLFALASCSTGGNAGPESASDDPLVAAAQEEGKLVFYSVEPDALNNAVGKAFTEKYGIQVEFLRLLSGELTERFAAEQSSGVPTADVIQLVGSKVWEQEKQWFVDLDEADLAGWSDYPSKAKHEVCADMRYSVGGVTYNNQLVPTERVPKSYEDFLDPYWKGKLLLTDPRGTPAYMGWAAAVQDKYGTEYLEGIARQDPVLVDSATPGAQKLAAGVSYANLGAHLSNSTAIRNQGAPLGFSVMSDVPTGLATCQGIAANAPHPNAAKLFMRWSLTQEAQNAGCADFEAATVLPNTDCVKVPEGWEPTNLDVMDDPARQEEIVEALGIG